MECDQNGCTSFAARMRTSADRCPEDPDSKPRFSDLTQMLASSSGESAELLLRAATLPPSEEVTFHVITRDTPFDFARFRSVDGEARQALVSERKQGLATEIGIARARVEAKGGTVNAETWLVPGMIVTARADQVPTILAEPTILSANIAGVDRPNVDNDHWDGVEFTNELRTERMFQNSPEPYNGQIDGRELRFGILEAENAPYDNYFHCAHEGWEESVTDPTSRIRKSRRCTSSNCNSVDACTWGGSSMHGTTVAWIAGGSIEQGQDSSYPGSQTDAQRTRSGHAQEAEMYLYVAHGGNTCANKLALQDAVAEGVDVVNMSWGSYHACSTTQDSCNMNDALVAAFDAGVFLVGSVGNSTGIAEEPPCNVGWPAMRPVVMSVGALSSRGQHLGIEELVRGPRSSYGQAVVYTPANLTRYAPLVDLMAPAELDGYFVNTSDYVTAGGTADGSSFAAPHVAAVALLTREWLLDLGWSAADNPRKEFANVLAMGDRYSGTSNPASESTWSVSETSGFGRVQAKWPHANSLGTPHSWTNFFGTITQGDYDLFEVPGNPQSSSKRGLKVSLAWFDFDFTDVADIRLRIIDQCPGQPATNIQTAYSSQVTRKGIQLTASQIAGRCLWVELYGLSVEPGGEEYYGAVYTYSNDSTEH